MAAKIDSLTILSEDVYALGRFYEAFFHMRPVDAAGGAAPVRLSDGNMRIHIEPRLTGAPAELHTFAIAVDDIAAAVDRMRARDAAVEVLDAPAGQPQGAVAAHDPAGNIFVLTQRRGENGESGGGRTHDRVIDHFGLRVRDPGRIADFYAEAFGLRPAEGPKGNGNIYLTDGRATMVITPWRMSDFEDTGITARGMDHIGFRVESIAALKADMDRVTERNPRFRPANTVVGRGKEGAGRLAMFQRTCPLGRHHMADSDGLLLDVTE
ncbi:MAG: VOC family protein [Alphaproteobacteria bacterium]|nr:VOC family protein [Alphaproteobacteria bacterium]